MTIYIALSKARSLCGQTLCVLHRIEPPADTMFPRIDFDYKKQGNDYFLTE